MNTQGIKNIIVSDTKGHSFEVSHPLEKAIIKFEMDNGSTEEHSVVPSHLYLLLTDPDAGARAVKKSSERPTGS